ncbi:hypothetical protein ABZT45_34615 [Streptomyces sp. NPDC005356]|uniref:hypothetical protein n=1 Tax=Streptomyces sp. NPDC005356 TaxID=3157167 RepID=UPI0033AFCEAF
MLWLNTQGGWAPWPAPLTTDGCVMRPPTPRSFGFGRILGALTVLTASVLALLELWADGHTVEVAGAIWAALLVAVADKMCAQLARLLQTLARPFGQVLLRRRG